MAAHTITPIQTQVVRMSLDAGMTARATAEAAGISIGTVTALRKKWRGEGWKDPVVHGAPMHQTAVETAVTRTTNAQAATRRNWHEQRLVTGELAGQLAGRLLVRANALIPEAGNARVVIEQATDPVSGVPVGPPRHRVLATHSSLEILRLTEAAKNLFLLADRSVGISDEMLSVTVTAPEAQSTAERRTQVLELLERNAS